MQRHYVPVLASLLLIASCGGGGGGNGIVNPPPPPPSSGNVATLKVEVGPAGPSFTNIPFVTITLCAPGTSTCQTIDNVEVDTGSTGVRIVSSVLNSTLRQALPQQLFGATSVPVAECAQFADGYSWGPVASADVEVTGEKASGIAIQVIGDPNFTSIPGDCSGPVPNEEDTVGTFGANGIIGIGVFMQDCGNACATGVISGTYYQCPTNGGACTGIMEATLAQVSNPVASFATDNNGVVIELPSVAAGGAASVTGSLIFGIGTESNNALGSATVLATDSGTGALDVTFGGTPLPLSLLDTGSNALYFNDSSLSVCAMGTAGDGFYCTQANLSATINTASNTGLSANFSVGDATTMLQANQGAAAYPQLAGPIGAANPQTFDFGLPYFYGRNVFVAIEGMSAGGATGPYFAY